MGIVSSSRIRRRTKRPHPKQKKRKKRKEEIRQIVSRYKQFHNKTFHFDGKNTNQYCYLTELYFFKRIFVKHFCINFERIFLWSWRIASKLNFVAKQICRNAAIIRLLSKSPKFLSFGLFYPNEKIFNLGKCLKPCVMSKMKRQRRSENCC